MSDYPASYFSSCCRRCLSILLVAFLPCLGSLGIAAEMDSVDVSETFGRLFTTPEQRKFLDRAGTSSSAQVNPALETVDRPLPVAPKAQLSGVVLRSDGKHMVWINGRSELSEGSGDQVARPGKPRHGSIDVPVHGNDRTVILKPGQVWLLDERIIEESYRVSTDKLSADKESTDLPEAAGQSEQENDKQ